MAIKGDKQGTCNSRDTKIERYYFDIEKCKHCRFKRDVIKMKQRFTMLK